MNFMIDTNTCSFLIKQKPAKLLDRFTRHAVGDIGLSSITLAELQYGSAKSSQPEKNQHALSEFLLPFTDGA